MTVAPVTRDTVLQPTSWCVTRPQKDQHLVYNSRTDEMHLVPGTGFLVYRLCDGLRAVGEIEQSLAEALGDNEEAIHEAVTGFLGKLLARGIVEVADDT
jgi:hypothetical protein